MVPEEDFWKDVVSGEWIFGRGAADMKGGLAAGLAVLDEIGEQVLDGTDRLNGNILTSWLCRMRNLIRPV